LRDKLDFGVDLQLKDSALVFPYPGKLKLGAVRFSQNHSIAREFHLINSFGERRLDLNSVAVEKIPASGAPD